MARRRPRPTGQVLVAAASTVVLLLTGTAWRTLDSANSGLATTGALAFGPSLSGDSGAPADDATDILLVGTDSRTDAQGKALTTGELAMLRAGEVAATNTDTIVVVRIPTTADPPRPSRFRATPT